MCLAIPGRVLETYEENGLPMGRIDFSGTQNTACLSYTPEAAVGSWVIVHAGFALSVLNEDEARASLAELTRLAEFMEADEQAARSVRDEEGADLVKYLDEYRDPALARSLLDEIARTVTRPWVIMEICGGQTHSILRYGIDQLLPREITLVHGPGCPVCVTPLETIDRALAIAERPEVIMTSFGDMLRVPGSHDDLFRVKSRGGDVRMVYSPLEAVKLARENPEREVVFLAVGFETTAPGNAMALKAAADEGLTNFSEIVSHVLVPPAMEAILSSPTNRVQGFLAAGHVCSIMGWDEYLPIAAKHGVPIVPTGFEPVDILDGILQTVKMLENGEAAVRNSYQRAVTQQGNPAARAVVEAVYTVCDRKWRGIGLIPGSGLRIRDELAAYDAEKKFAVGDIVTEEPAACISGEILQGLKKPDECPAFGNECTPQHPLGATMVSSEGACAAYYRYSRKGLS